MITEIEILIQNLRSNDSEIRMLALDTLSRYKFQINIHSEYILQIQEILIGFGRAKDEESQSLIEAAIDNLKSQIIEQNSQSNNFESSISAEINLKDLEHSNPKFRKQCLVQVINHDIKEAYDGVLDMLVNEEEVQVLDLAIKALSIIAEPKISKLLQVFVYHPELDVSKSAKIAICELGDYKDIIDFILPSIDLSDVEEINNITDTLSKYNPEDIFFHIKNKLQDPLEHRRLLALKVLSKIEGDKAIKLINISANDKSPKIKSLAISALIGRAQTGEIVPILNRLVQDTDIEVSEVALQHLNNYSDQPSVQRIKLSMPKNHSSEKSKTITKDPVDETTILTNTRNIEFKDPSSVDDQIEVEFLGLGKRFYHQISSGEISQEELSTNFAVVQKAINRLDQLEQMKQNANLVKSIKNVIGGNLNHKLTLQNAKIALEEAYIDLGETGFGLISTSIISTRGVEPSVKKLNELFNLRKELSNINS